MSARAARNGLGAHEGRAPPLHGGRYRGGGPTVGGESAAAIVRGLRPRLVIPMHYRTDAVNFLDPPDEFLAVFRARVERIPENELEVEQFLGSADDPTVVLLAPPVSA